jgi:mediator of RNA polymerase II transcription subunit 14
MLARDVINTLDTLNTLLSERLNLHEYDRIPWQFKDYTIKSGRATFRVAGEFEVDLGIADEDPKNQFWFIDFRFLFSPSPIGLPIAVRKHLEDRSNVALKDGLLGCYHLLHEMVLTHKISEFRRQAMDLARGKWIKGLKVEPLNRSLSIQYWVGRYAQDSYKSWIILGVHSGKRKEGRPSPKSISHLFIRWFRNGREVKDVDIPFDVVNISAVSLLKTVIAAHVNFILTSIFEKLQTNPIFAKREADLNIFTSSNEPAESILKVQLTKSEHLSISVDPITGRFLFGQESSTIARMMENLNFKSRDPAFGVHTFIENLRAWVVTEDFSSHGASVGWIRDPTGPSVKGEDLTSKTTKIALQTAWFRRASWLQNWWALLRVGVDGERWFLLETYALPPYLPTKN